MITPREQAIVSRILSSYGIEWTSIRDSEKGYRNRSYPIELTDGRLANLILYKTEPGILSRIKNANRISNYLATRDFPARRTLESRIIQIGFNDKIKYGAIYEYLPGHTIPWEGYTMPHIKLLGATMGQLHTALRDLPREQLPLVTDEYLVILRSMQTYFSDPEVTDALSQKLRIIINFPLYLEKLLITSRTLPGQPLHMDFVRSNILFDDIPVISGILDFEKVAWGHPAFDIARTLAFLLVDCKYKTERQVRKYFLQSGYIKRGGGANYSPKLINALVELFLLYDFYKFLCHNPYDYLHTNEHFVRTRSILLTQGLISMAPDSTSIAVTTADPVL